ncbi:MAG: helix-turn-helix domain-containing protein [Defluviitaleaceae bacterium]|nr:helix-turn-helix domain-containing protein [Defluviitaleaceae bacterium]
MKINPQKLSLALADTGQTLKELAEASGVSRATVSYINCGKSCRPDVAGKLARALNVPLERLIETKEA